MNDRANLMELDGYNEELGIAFEHNGRQHCEIDWLSGHECGKTMTLPRLEYAKTTGSRWSWCLGMCRKARFRN